jgi:hypothetical protein
MAEQPWPSEVELSAYLGALETVQQKFRIPAPVVVLAADLWQKAPPRVGVRGASELVAALIVKAAQATEADLGDAIGDYRETRAYSILSAAAEQGAFSLPTRHDLKLN